MGLIRRPDDLDAAWLGALLGAPVADFSVARIGTGQMSETYRVAPSYADGDGAGPATVCVKLAASDPTSRATGVGLGAYEREIRFYREVAPRLAAGDPPLAACRHAEYDAAEGWFTLVLDDVAPAQQGDQIAGCSVEQARVAMCALGRLHAPLLGDAELAATDWLNGDSPLDQALVGALLSGFKERYAERVADEHMALIDRFVGRLDAWLADDAGPRGLAHADYRLDNLLFAPDAVTVVDWQTVGWGAALLDASYFLGGSLTVEDRRLHERELLSLYHAELLAGAGPALSWEDCWADYRRQCFHGILMAVAASMLVERTERGDDMFVTTLARHAQQALDLDAEALLPSAATPRPAPLRPAPADEARHADGPEQLWNESWYFDVVSDDETLGAYVRIGLYPNLGVCWYTAFVVGPGRPTVAVVDLAAPLPEGDGLAIETGALAADHVCDAPLESFRVLLRGTGVAHDDPAALLRSDDPPGTPVDVALDLRFATAGEPYRYRMATRYEIPCDVTGTVRVGDEDLTLTGRGQRDHSWGARDWWSMDWVWSAGGLDDGTRWHGVQLRLPELPPMGVGYVQPPGAALVECDAVAAREDVAADGLITRADLALEPGGVAIEVEPLAFGPLRLVAPDGRVAQFPRAMCRVRAADGRTGTAWLEWCRNPPR